MSIFFRNLLQSTRRRFTFVGISVILLLSAVAIFSDYGLLKRFKLEYHRSQLNDKIKDKYRVQDSLQNEIKMLVSDSLTIERIAREKYGMVKPNEQIYFVPKKNK